MALPIVSYTTSAKLKTRIKDTEAAEILPIYRTEYAGFKLHPLMPTFTTIVFITVKAKVSET